MESKKFSVSLAMVLAMMNANVAFALSIPVPITHQPIEWEKLIIEIDKPKPDDYFHYVTNAINTETSAQLGQGELIQYLSVKPEQAWRYRPDGLGYGTPLGGMTKADEELAPDAYANTAMSLIDMHHMFNEILFNHNEECDVYSALRSAYEHPEQRGSYRSWMRPYLHYNDQKRYHSQVNGGVAVLERDYGDSFTFGFHAIFMHQFLVVPSNRHIRNRGLYLGAQGRFAPERWHGWQAAGLIRYGIEDLHMHRGLDVNGVGKGDDEWGNRSGAVRMELGRPLKKGPVQVTPFAALDYTFVQMPKVIEGGVGQPLHVSNELYDSLRSQLGFRIKKAKAFGKKSSYEIHADAAWNHEMKDVYGTQSARFMDVAGSKTNHKLQVTDSLGRDSLTVGAGTTLKLDKKCDITFYGGTELFRRSGKSLWGHTSVQWYL